MTELVHIPPGSWEWISSSGFRAKKTDLWWMTKLKWDLSSISRNACLADLASEQLAIGLAIALFSSGRLQSVLFATAYVWKTEYMDSIGSEKLEIVFASRLQALPKRSFSIFILSTTVAGRIAGRELVYCFRKSRTVIGGSYLIQSRQLVLNIGDDVKYFSVPELNPFNPLIQSGCTYLIWRGNVEDLTALPSQL